MKKNNYETIRKMWNNPRQKALLKLGMWFCFLIIMAIVLSVMNLLGKNNLKQPTKKDEPIPPTIETNFIPFEEMWLNLEQKNYQYTYRINKLETNEIITYQGTKKNQVEEGYRESKLGIIKYRIEKEKTYQILVDQEIEIDNLIKPEDSSYLIISKLKEKIVELKPQENIIGSTKYVTFQNETEKMQFIINPSDITKIQITTPTTEYILEFTLLKE